MSYYLDACSVTYGNIIDVIVYGVFGEGGANALLRYWSMIVNIRNIPGGEALLGNEVNLWDTAHMMVI